ncbi:MAG: DUF5916 domain-containing protein, partial [Bacteroidota bacterium]
MHFPIDSGLNEQVIVFKIFHNKKSLNIGIFYQDTESKITVSTLKRDLYREVMVLSDAVGIVIDPFSQGDNGYFFGLNASGVQFDALIGNINNLNESWNTVWQGNASQEESKRFYEISIPLEAINYDPQKENWNIQCFINDASIPQSSTLKYSQRNFSEFDLRYTETFAIEALPNKVARKFNVQPSITYASVNDKEENTSSSKLITSLDGQYNINSSLRLDVSLNPDFSQVEVDQQVTNLTRFDVNFPERRKFFLENSDLFNDLGTFFNNPFYSRRIGQSSPILYGLKLSGNLGDKTRIGALNVQTKNIEETNGKNYSVAVLRHAFSNQINGTVFGINTQAKNNYNRVAGTALNYKSKNNRWTSSMNYSKTISNSIRRSNHYFRAALAFQNRNFEWIFSAEETGKNFIPETGFVPLVYNYDALSETVTRETYKEIYNEIQLKRFPKNSKSIDWFRIFWLQSRVTLNAD